MENNRENFVCAGERWHTGSKDHIRVDPIGGADYIPSSEQYCIYAIPSTQIKDFDKDTFYK